MEIPTPTTPQTIGAALLSIGTLWASSPKIKELLAKFCDCEKCKPSKVGKKGHSTDEKPPEGFISHVEIVCSACCTAPANVQVEYMKKGFTEAQVLEAECQRLIIDKEEGGTNE